MSITREEITIYIILWFHRQLDIDLRTVLLTDCNQLQAGRQVVENYLTTLNSFFLRNGNNNNNACQFMIIK